MFTRITPPKFKVGKYTLNEYELRNLMLEVAEGKRQPGIIVREGNISAEILASGQLSQSLPGLAIASNSTLGIIKINRLK